jgi:tRNA 2-thiouridine synthesizing protein A
MSTHTLDARRLLCPLPVIRTENTVKTLSAGDYLDILCTDPGAVQDISAWCRIHGHHFLDSRSADGILTLRLQVGGGHD